MFVFDSVLVSVAGDGLTIVVLLSFFSVFSPPAGGVTVVSFCSHAASSAAPARMQMYFFIFVKVSKWLRSGCGGRRLCCRRRRLCCRRRRSRFGGRGCGGGRGGPFGFFFSRPAEKRR